MCHLAAASIKLANAPQALAYLDEAKAMLLHFYDEQHPALANILRYQARALKAIGEVGKAKLAYEEALKIYRAKFAENDYRIQNIIKELLQFS